VNCPNGIEFLSGIFIVNVLRVRRHFYETHTASRNRVAHNRAQRKIFPKAPARSVKCDAPKLGGARNSTKAVFLRKDILSRKYLLVPKSTSALFYFAFSKGFGAERKEAAKERKTRVLSLELKLDHVNACFCAESAYGFAWNRYRETENTKQLVNIPVLPRITFSVTLILKLQSGLLRTHSHLVSRIMEKA